MRHRVLVLVTILGIIMSACGGSTAPVDATQSLEDALGYSDPEGLQRVLRQRQSEVQDLVTTCMTEQGFTYIPYVPAEIDLSAQSTSGLSEEEYAATSGYGIATTVDELFQSDLFNPDADPNTAITEAMSVEERAEYNLVLFGSETAADDAVSGVRLGGGAIGGCAGDAQKAIYGEGGPFQLFGDFGEAIEELQDRIDADPRIIDINVQWSECMAEQGWSYASPQGAERAAEQRIQEFFFSALLAAGGGLGALGEDGAGGPGSLLAQIEYDPEGLAELESIERQIATADYSCRRPHLEILDVVTAEYELEFIAENGDLIQRLRGDE